MIGIYKITSPSGKTYIGQSVDVEKRWRRYLNMNCEVQKRLYRSFLKHGVSNHKFEVVEECSIELLNERERYYQDIHLSIGPNGLNLVLTESNSKRRELSADYRKRLSESRKGIVVSQETKDKLSAINKGKKIPDDVKKKMSAAHVGILKTDETKKRMSLAKKGIVFTDDQRLKMSASGKKNWQRKKQNEIEQTNLFSGPQ